MTHYEDCIMFNLAKAYQRVHGEFKTRFSAVGLTPMQLLVLEALFEEEGLSSGEIGSRLVLDSATLSGVLDRMIDGGWIVKGLSDNDRRVSKINLSGKALTLKNELIQMVGEANGAIMRPFSVEERLLLIRLLKDLRV